jgi:hypothetical protein
MFRKVILTPTHRYQRELATHSWSTCSFPERDLLDVLCNTYFATYNDFWPLLHRPMFMRSVSRGQHLVDPSFAQIVLLVCALASHWCDDIRVLYPGSTSWQSAGWRWYSQVRSFSLAQFSAPSLHDVQFCFVRPNLSNVAVSVLTHAVCTQLSALFEFIGTARHSCSVLIGIGLRLAQQAGVHRRRAIKTPITSEEILWNRAFW